MKYNKKPKQTKKRKTIKKKKGKKKLSKKQRQKIDMNKNGKIDSQDFALLRNKKK